MTLVLVGVAILGAVAAYQLLRAAVIWWRRRGHCKHEIAVRFWFKGHRYMIVCKQCGRRVATGRDTRHRYPRQAA